MSGGVQTGVQTLRCRLLVTGRAVDLSREEKACDIACLVSRPEAPRVDELLLDGGAWPLDLYSLKAVNASNEIRLNIHRQRR